MAARIQVTSNTNALINQLESITENDVNDVAEGYLHMFGQGFVDAVLSRAKEQGIWTSSGDLLDTGLFQEPKTSRESGKAVTSVEPLTKDYKEGLPVWQLMSYLEYGTKRNRAFPLIEPLMMEIESGMNPLWEDTVRAIMSDLTETLLT